MKVFISHSSHDSWVARQISNLIEATGHTTFLDAKDMKTGESIDDSIQEHLKDCDHLVLLISPKSIASHWVFVELGGAKALGKRIVPILFHVGANEIPSVVANLLARDINDFDKYLAELAPDSKKKRTKRSTIDTPSRASAFAPGDRVRVIDVELLTESDKDLRPVWVSSMDKFSGVEATITQHDPVDGWLRIDADKGAWWWHPDWLSMRADD